LSTRNMTTVPTPNTTILWKDILVLIDDGRSTADDYARFTALARRLRAKYAYGIGVLTVVPVNAKPPSDKARQAINEALLQSEAALRCVCWLVEGDGFHAAMVRAVLTGIRVFGKRAYPTQVVTSLEQALGWMLPYLQGGKARLPEVSQGVAHIRAARSAAPGS
jgi:hypothetical protein